MGTQYAWPGRRGRPWWQWLAFYIEWKCDPYGNWHYPDAVFEFTHMDLQAVQEHEPQPKSLHDMWAQADLRRSCEETTASKKNPVRAQLNALTETLTKIHEAKALSNEAPNKGHLQARIKQLETALAAIPEDDAELATERASLATQPTDTKRQLLGSKPIGARIDGARAALGRARQRQAEAEQVTALETELQELEASLTTEAPIEATATPESQAYTILGQMIDQLTADEYVHPGHVEAAKTHVRQLFAGFRDTLQQAEATRAAAAGTPLVPKEVRHTTKSPPAAPLPAKPGTLARHSGKQPRKELITDYFSKRKVIKSIGKETAGFPATSKEAAAGAQVSCALLLGKVQILEQAFHDEHLDFVFIQEGRARAAEVRRGLPYTMYVGASDSLGGHGCQVWVRTGAQFRASSYAAPSSHLYWVTGRDVQGIPFILVSAHAPSDHAPAAEREAFWDLLLQTLTLRGRTPSAKMFLGIDANGRVGAEHSGTIGACDSEAFTANGSDLLSVLVRLRLAAINTFYDVGYTRAASRIDYICGPLDELSHAVQAFQTMLHRLQVPVGASIDEKTQAMMSQVRTAARHAFGRPEDRPRQPWISDDTWSILRLLAPSRRVVHAAGREAHRAYFHRIFLGWAAQRTGVFHVTSSSQTRLGWAARCALRPLRHVEFHWRLLNAMAWRLCQRLAYLVKHFVHFDRHLFLEDKAREAQCAAARGDWRGTFGVVRSLSGRAASLADHPVLLKSGALSSSEAERQARWQEHLREVFNGTEVPMDQLRAQPVEAPLISPTVEVTPDAVAASPRQLGRNKGVGRDGVPAGLLVAGGKALATPLAALYQEIVDTERWPVHWAGGRMQNVHKRKGPFTDCDESRGIVLEDHAAKGLKQLLSHMVTGPYQDNIPEVQHGAVAGRGTDYAAHLVHSFQAYCNAAGRSSFAWFVDLVKAFDRIVREVVLGWPCGATDPEAYLASLGLNPDQSAWIAQWVARHSCLFAQWGVSPKVIRLLKNLHAASWFSYGDVDTAIVARVGGRQGCKYGAMVFNGTFSLAVVLIRDALLDAGILLRLRALCSMPA
ncbi:unnamed protein product [Prorocentrum cordatum]|uniref:Reverse transcriptase domain-containing protein n=1 Tax=Prorocentrum cordatum TaxID=2364126 RepID=A0ABN9QYE6_9DINO|nr:unnamed protein product [Polarella glacialis]